VAFIKRKRTKKGETRWEVRYRTPVGKERSQTFTTRREADAFAKTTEADKLRGSWIDPRSASVTFGEYAEQWRESRVHRPTTRAHVETNLRRHVLPTFGDRPLGSIRTSEIQNWVQDRAQVLAPATVVVIYRYLSSIFKAAQTDRMILASPCVGIRLPRSERGPVIPLEPEQVQALIEAAPDRYRALVVLGAGTGLRQGEAFGLAVPSVNFFAKRLDVRQQLILLPKQEPVLGPPKTPASYRTLPLPEFVVAELSAHIRRYPPGPDGLVFTNDQGGPISRTRFSADVWRPTIACAAGVPAGTGFHALRHFYASLLIQEGASVKVVQARLGHANATETLNTYAHLWPDSEDHTRAAIDRVFGLARDARGTETRGESVSAGQAG
jgi:integrase